MEFENKILKLYQLEEKYRVEKLEFEAWLTELQLRYNRRMARMDKEICSLRAQLIEERRLMEETSKERVKPISTASALVLGLDPEVYRD